MEKLPNEVIQEMFGYLDHYDRLSCSMVCKCWAEVFSTRRILGDVCLVLRAPQANINSAVTVLLNTNRDYINLKIVRGELLEINEEFWARISKELIHLELEFCEITPVIFFSILQRCPKLESFAFSGNTSLEWPTAENVSIAKLQESLCNVRILSLYHKHPKRNAAIEQIFAAMPNVTSLSYVHEYPDDYPEESVDDFDETAFQRVVACLMRSEQKLVDLEFRGSEIDSNNVIRVVEQHTESLRKLRVNECISCGPPVEETIAKCTKLQLLSVYRSVENLQLEAILSKTQDLKDLILRKCLRLEDLNIPSAIRLRGLDLSKCESLSINSLCSLEQLTTLQHLNLSYTKCDVEVVRHLASLVDLRCLKLRGCKKLNVECISIICDNLKKLEILDFAYRRVLTDEAGVKLRNLKRLHTLCFGGLPELTDLSFKKGVGSPEMKELNIENCFFSDSALMNIATHHKRLEDLELWECKRITDVGLGNLVESLPRLRTLRLSGCPLLTDRSLEAISLNCPNLRVLDVYGSSISNDAKSSFASQRPSVELWVL